MHCSVPASCNDWNARGTIRAAYYTFALCKVKLVDLTPGVVQKPTGISAIAAKEWDKLITEPTVSGITLSPAHRITVTVRYVGGGHQRLLAGAPSQRRGLPPAGTGAPKLHSSWMSYAVTSPRISTCLA